MTTQKKSSEPGQDGITVNVVVLQDTLIPSITCCAS